MTLWILSFKEGTCTGPANDRGNPSCLLADLDVPTNGMGLFASGMVPLDGRSFNMSGFYRVPTAHLGIYSTVGYEFQFRLVDHGSPSTYVANPEQQQADFFAQWTTVDACTVRNGVDSSACNNRKQYMVRFPPKKDISAK